MKVVVVVVLVVLMVVCQSFAVGPGFKTTVSQGGLNYLKDVGMTILEQKIGALDIPDQHGDAGTPVGHIHYSVTAIHMSGVKLPSSSAILEPAANAVSLKISQIAAKITLNWSWDKPSFPHLSDHGSADITFSDATVGAELSVGAANGRPTAQVISCEVSIVNLDITFHGGASWFYDLFKKDIADLIKKAASSSLSAALKKGMDEGLQHTLATLPVTQKINDWLYIDYALPVKPTITTTYLCLDTQGEFYDVHNNTHTSFEPGVLPNSVTDEMVQMFVSDYVLDTVSAALFIAKKMEKQVVDSMLPTTAPVRLNTTYFKERIPALYSTFPHMMLMLDMYVTTMPLWSFSRTGALLQASGNIDVYIETSKKLVISLAVHMFCSGAAEVRGLNITGQLTLLNVSLVVRNSIVGPFNVSVVQDLANKLFAEGVVPFANFVLRPGFPLPTIDGIHFVKPVVGWGAGFMYVSSDVTYTPPKSNTLSTSITIM